MSHLPSFTGILLTLAVLAGTPADARAQARPGDVGLGIQFGDPTGISLKLYQHDAVAYDLLAAWDLDRFLFLSGHVVFERSLEDSPLNYYIGPGAVIGLDADDLTLGLSASAGTNFFVEQFEIFLQVNPRLDLLPRTKGGFGAGLGLRYYFTSPGQDAD